MKFETSIPNPIYVDSNEKTEEAIKRCRKSELIAVDTETLGLKYHKLDDQVLYMGLSPDPGVRYFVPRNRVLIEIVRIYLFSKGGF